MMWDRLSVSNNNRDDLLDKAVTMLSVKSPLEYQQVQVMKFTSSDPVVDPSDEAELERLAQMREDDSRFDAPDDAASEIEEAFRDIISDSRSY